MALSKSRAFQAARWRLRGLLAAMPARRPVPPPAGGGAGLRIAYLFAGTYGDFVQALKPLARLAAAFPRAELILYGAGDYAREFASELPPSLRAARAGEIGSWALRPVDLLATNCVGVYRVRFDWIARFCARRAYGFRHAHESRRGGYTATVPLVLGASSFAALNLAVLDLAGIPAGGEADPGAPGAGERWGAGTILFHIGSAGLKREFGPRVYARLVLSLLRGLDGAAVEVVMGPGDEDVALEVRSGTGRLPRMHPVGGLIRALRGFEGRVLCFNSFAAHLCQYLGKPAVVIHREAVPYGYDCAPLHRQIVLTRERDWDLSGVWEALGIPTASARARGKAGAPLAPL